MGFSCFLLGHDFGDAEVEREREEQGSEVVTTIRERETCSRCGTQRVVSENTEVTTLETAADIVGDDLTDETTADPDTEPVPEADADSTSASPDEDTPEPGEATVQEAETERTAVDHATDPATTGVEAETDDGVILDDDATEPETETAEGEREPGQWPEEPDDDADDWTPETEPDPGAKRPEVESTAEAVTVPSGEFHCPECGFSTPVESSSLREGDFCPDCHRGSLAHHLDE